MVVTSEVSSGNIRQQTLELGKSYKAAWIALGQSLFTIHKDKFYKEWGFLSFQAYCVKELGLKESTAQKILKSYRFLEKEEPRIVHRDYLEEETPQSVPDYESVNLLRLAKDNERLTTEDFSQIRESVIEKAREPKDVRAQVKRILDEKIDPESPEVKEKKRVAAIRRLVTTLRTTGRELKNENLLPAFLLTQINELTEKLEHQI